MIGGSGVHNSDVQTRAVFLAGLMFLWLFAGTVAFAGNATAQVNSANIDGQEYFQGDTVEIDLAGAEGFDEGDNVQVREVTGREGGTPVNSATRLTRSTDGRWMNFSTSNLPVGDYVIRNADTGSYLNASGDFNNTILGEVDSRPAEIGIYIQTLSADFDDGDGGQEAHAGEEIELQFESPERAGGFDVNVSADGLEINELSETFSDLEDAGVIGSIDDTTYASENILVLENVDNYFEENVQLAAEIDSGAYEILFSVTDTTAEATASVNIAPELSQSDLTYTFEIPNDGETYSVGIPGEIEGSLADMIDPSIEGYTVFKYDEGDWIAVADFENTELDALEAIAIATEDGAGQSDTFTLQMEFTSQSSTATPPQTELSQGWNFVSAPKHGAADTVFGVEDTYLVLDRFKQSPSGELQDFDSFNDHFIGSDDNTVNPFKGYYVYVENDTNLPGVLSGVETREDIYTQLDVEMFG